MMRLFIGIDPPVAVKDTLETVMDGVAGARWQSEAQLHMTLRFIGEVDRHCAQDIHEALLGLDHPAFEIMVRGVGSFDRRGRVHTLWAGIHPPEPVRTLHRKIDRLVVGTGLAPESRSYAPHITMARLSGRAGSLEAFMMRAGSLATPPWRVDSICLYESTLTQDGAVYAILQRYPLR